MLVLTRKVGETIVIDSTIRITVVHIEGGKVRLGITAPGDVPIDRQEIHARKKTQRAESSQRETDDGRAVKAGLGASR